MKFEIEETRPLMTAEQIAADQFSTLLLGFQQIVAKVLNENNIPVIPMSEVH